MAHWRTAKEDWDDDPDSDPEWAELDGSDDDDDLCFPCPYCHREILEESERCPYCEHYLSREDAPASHKPIWFIVGLLACLYAVYRWTWP